VRNVSAAAHDEEARVTKRILIVDDDRTLREVLKNFFLAFEHGHTYEIATAPDGTYAIGALLQGQFDLVLLDMRMPLMGGLDVLTQMRHHDIRVPVLMLTGNQDTKAAAEALKHGVFAYVPKPVAMAHLEHLVALALSSVPPAADDRRRAAQHDPTPESTVPVS